MSAVTSSKQASLSKILQIAAYAQEGFHEGYSINSVLAPSLAKLDAASRSTAQAIIYEAIRRRALIDFFLSKALNREPALPVLCLLEVAVAALLLRFTTFTVVDQAVECAKRQTMTRRASGFVNAVLRKIIANQTRWETQAFEIPEVRFNAPTWWINKIKATFPEQATHILEQSTQAPPLTLRVNARKSTPQAYLERLREAGIQATQVGLEAVQLLHPLGVEKIPGFLDGVVSVQDAGTQLAGYLLPIKSGDRVLDACAAPGGKTCHILEHYDCEMTALEIQPERAKRVEENLVRLSLSANLIVADALDTGAWWDSRPFDAILLDAPCSASGVVSRQPDTPWLRVPSDIEQLARLQHKLLKGLWKTLKKGGHLLYATCSIFPEEGPEQIQSFLREQPDAKSIGMLDCKQSMMTLIPQAQAWMTGETLPGVHDGFFYALLKKE